MDVHPPSSSQGQTSTDLVVKSNPLTVLPICAPTQKLDFELEVVQKWCCD